MNIKKNKKSFISIYKLKIFYFLKKKLTYLYKKIKILLISFKLIQVYFILNFYIKFI